MCDWGGGPYQAASYLARKEGEVASINMHLAAEEMNRDKYPTVRTPRYPSLEPGHDLARDVDELKDELRGTALQKHEDHHVKFVLRTTLVHVVEEYRNREDSQGGPGYYPRESMVVKGEKEIKPSELDHTVKKIVNS